EQAQANLDKLLNGPRPEEIAAAKAAADVSLAKLQQAQRGLTAEERASLKARVDSAAAANDLANKQLARTQSLYDAGAAPKQQFDVALANQQQSAAQLKDAQETYRRAQEGTPKEELAEARHGYQQALENLKLVEKGSRPEDIQAGKAALAQAEAAFEEVLRGNRPEDIAKAKAAHQQAALQAKSAATTVHEHLVTAPADAVVDHVLVADGDVMTANAPVVQLSYPTDIWLRVYIPEEQLYKVKVGDSADIAVDGIAEVLKGRVESIATQGEFTPANLQSPEERGRQVFGVRLRLDPPDPRVKAGMYATVKRVGQWP
ncbi:MAG TPA: HlyD family efflux transporter periplasmic adaptor subunit, partial [Fimbriimonadaceae bacterium]|nr:HlyD family efflux transporter periplasmic adaptor subunit [Fimbriimonadaceae bacterium]